MGALTSLGRRTVSWVEEFGDFCRMTGQTCAVLPSSLTRWRTILLIIQQMFDVGTRSLPVVMITGMFVGMVLAVQAVSQFKNIGLEGQLGSIVNLSVVRELGPVLAGVLLAGRVGGAMAAELATMHVTEQIDALRAMGADPIRYLVVPRFVACLLLGPLLVMYADVMGIFGGYYVSVIIYDVNAAAYWTTSHTSVEFFDVASGLLKSVLFAGTLALISCNKAFRSGPGAAGVGRACTEAFVSSCMVILGLDFFINVLLNTIYTTIYGFKPLF